MYNNIPNVEEGKNNQIRIKVPGKNEICSVDTLGL